MKTSKKIRIASAKAVMIAVIITIVAWILQNNFAVVINRSESLSLHGVVIRKGKLPTKLDQIFVFKVRNNPHYKMQEMDFIKLVGGLPGEEIIVLPQDKNKEMGSEIYVGQRLIGIAKPVSLKGKNLTAISTKVILENKFFAYTPHKDSFDSRYQDLGLIDASDIIGTAIASF